MPQSLLKEIEEQRALDALRKKPSSRTPSKPVFLVRSILPLPLHVYSRRTQPDIVPPSVTQVGIRLVHVRIKLIRKSTRIGLVLPRVYVSEHTRRTTFRGAVRGGVGSDHYF